MNGRKSGQWFFTADPHWGHANIVKYCKRPFLNQIEESLMDLIQKGSIPERDLRISNESMEKMNDTIFNSINSVVGPNDNLVIVGDFCFARKEEYLKKAREYRDRINCSNVYLLYGNHDSQDLKPLFTACYYQYMFNINGHKIFCCHYPCRSWEGRERGTIHVSGHTHSSLTPEDNGQLLNWKKKIYLENFKLILKDIGSEESVNLIIQKLLDVVASTNGINLVLDVGVDNVRQGMPFGTPWGMDEIVKDIQIKKLRQEKLKLNL